MAALAAVAGCQSVGTGRHTPRVNLDGRSILLDGRLDEWPADAAAMADPDFMYFRVSVGEPTNLQQSRETLHLMVDLDDDPSTGRVDPGDEATDGLGIDLEVQFSPASADGTRTEGGVRVFGYDAAGGSIPLSHADIDLLFLPTYTSEWFEVRFSRHLTHLAGLPGPSTSAAGVFVLSSPDGEVVGSSDPFEVQMPRLAQGRARRDATIPDKGDALRIVSFNVLKASPRDDPEPFGRILQVLDPDIVLFQEWDDATAQELATWFTLHVWHEVPWQAMVSQGRGVAIVSRHSIRPLLPESISAPGGDWPVREVGAVVDTPIGPVAATSVHLKCCGGSEQDARRLAETTAVNDALRSAMTFPSASAGQDGADVSPPSIVVIGGDMNLVGSPEPLARLGHALDLDASDLGVAKPIVRGDSAVYSWRDPASEFSIGRLDYLLYSDASARVVRSFVLDGSRLTDAALARLGLDRGDTATSDHLPIVIDIAPR